MLLCLTANHRNASFEILEKLSIGAPNAAQPLVDGNPIVRGAVVLATCNRFEAYLDVDRAQGAKAARETVDLIGRASGVDPLALRQVVTILTGDKVVQHLFAVSSGLESVVVGEDEISGQVRRALTHARSIGTTSSALEQLFQKATRTSRDVKTQTSLGGAGRSLVRLALELATSRVTDWSQARVLIVGTGQYAATTAAALRDLGVATPGVYSPSGRAAPFAAKYTLRLELALADAIAASDVVITCTATMVIDAAAIVNGDRRLIIDLGLPRNVDPAIARLPGVELLDLETITLHAPVADLSAASDARALIGAAVADFAANRIVEPAIVALRRHVFDLLDAEIERARSRGDSSEETESALRHLAGVLLHAPSVRARELAHDGRADEFVAGLEAIYGIETQLAAEQTRGTDSDVRGESA